MEAAMYARETRRRGSGLPVTDRSGRTIGRIVGREYQKLVTRPDQMLRSPPGFGFDAWAIDQLVLPRVERFVVISRIDKKTYTASADTFRRFRVVIDRGAGPQYVLPLVYWDEQGDTSAGAEPVSAPERTTTDALPDAPAQGRLL
jgi:hypothetical protein